MNYYFYGNTARPSAKNKEYKVDSIRELYDRLSGIWCEYTCTPRLRDKWSQDNKTLGQCSITAFLAQDIFGGKVYGILQENGGIHCYNEVDGEIFDLTSEQFGQEKLIYDKQNEQDRAVQFAKQEKYERYLYLKEKLLNS